MRELIPKGDRLAIDNILLYTCVNRQTVDRCGFYPLISDEQTIWLPIIRKL